MACCGGTQSGSSILDQLFGGGSGKLKLGQLPKLHDTYYIDGVLIDQ